ncbi:MAG: hypothetical protein RMJ66_08685 [Bacteroidia bacterium]|nr:hypothetical protein [Bacteroidia bacterium]
MQGDLLGFQRYVVERREHPEIIEVGYRSARSFKGHPSFFHRSHKALGGDEPVYYTPSPLSSLEELG